jgi:hypothetical protein
MKKKKNRMLRKEELIKLLLKLKLSLPEKQDQDSLFTVLEEEIKKPPPPPPPPR